MSRIGWRIARIHTCPVRGPAPSFVEPDPSCHDTLLCRSLAHLTAQIGRQDRIQKFIRVHIKQPALVGGSAPLRRVAKTGVCTTFPRVLFAPSVL